jgi:hypothetical protein
LYASIGANRKSGMRNNLMLVAARHTSDLLIDDGAKNRHIFKLFYRRPPLIFGLHFSDAADV